MIPAAAFGSAPARRIALGTVHPAMRLAWLVLAVTMALAAPWPVAAVVLAVSAVMLSLTGLGLRGQVQRLRPWWPMAVLALLVHTLTTTGAAPLGHPSWAGAVAGLRALLRVAATLGALALTARASSVDDVVAGIGWWLSPLARFGLPVEDLGLAVAVACGTVPQVVGEGRRLQAVTRLRRHAHDPRVPERGPRRRAPWRGWVDGASLVVPLLETLGRRAETLDLALRGRRPTAVPPGAPRAREWVGLGTGLLAAAALMLLQRGGQ